MDPPRPDPVRPVFETGILLASAAALLLPATVSVVALVGLIALWLAARPPRQEKVFVAVALALAAASLATSLLLWRAQDPASEGWEGEVAEGFTELWQELGAHARTAAGEFEQPPPQGGEHLAEFHLLEELLPAPPSDVTLLLLAPDGAAVAWAGEGLLHEPDARQLPVSGFAFRRGYSALTVFAVESLTEEPRPWRLVAGRSFGTEGLPFATAVATRPANLHWALGDSQATPQANALRLQPEEGPTVFIERPEGIEGPSRRVAVPLRRLGIGLVGLTLLALALLRLTGGRLLPADSVRQPPPGLPLLASAGAAALGVAATFQQPLTVALAVAAGLATWGLVRRRAVQIYPGAGAVRGALALLVLVATAYAYQRWTQPADLAASLIGSADSFALCLVWCLAALGLLALSASRYAESLDDQVAWWATLLLLGSGAACDFPWIALPLLALAGGAIVHWITGVDFGRRPAALGGLLVLASIAGSASWEIAYREAFRRQLELDDLPKIAPPTLEELSDLHVVVYDHFEGRDFDHLLSPVVGQLDSSDLAFILWRDSPLAQLDALSALAVTTGDGKRSTFSFGLSLDDELQLALPPDRWSVPQVPEWSEGMILGQSELRIAGRPWASVSYWLLPRPGFRLEVDEIGELEEALLRGGGHKKAIDGLPRGVAYGLYDPSGRAITSPWGEAPPLDPGLWAADSEVEWIETPQGRAWVWWREGADGVELLFLPQLTPRAGLERVGIHALGSLTWVTLIALLALVFALPRTAFRGLFERTVRSYSKRMILVYTVLLLLPLIALNLVLLQSFSDRERRAQRAEARSALSSARLFLLDYLRGLEFGFDLNTQVNRALMEWISSVVEHPVNLYWDSRVFASSQQELFTAGLLRRRIPGEVYSRIALSGYKMGLRQHRGEVGYLELYAPLDIAGTFSQGLFLSVPLIEQEEEVEREFEVLRRRAILVTSALVLLLFAVGSRLARSFTNPIMELIGGTRRIAAGAPFLEVAPREHELEALANAIDDMARRLAEGRRKLVLEKQVVERIVANITSGVVSLDHRRRVLLQNAVAAELLGSEIGEEIEQTLDNQPRLRPVREFLRSAGKGRGQEALALQDEEGEERDWTLTWVPIPGAQEPAALLVVEDATEVLRGQRLEAWAEMARIIAHEIKNPLTPIRLSADHMRQVYRMDRDRFDEVFERCITNILSQVEELSDIASDFSIYSRIPRAVMTEADLIAAMRDLVESYRDAGREGVEIVFTTELPELKTRFDSKLLPRAARNVLENALRASEGRGEVELAVVALDESAQIRVVDSGRGVEPDHLRRIFEPYFSTYDSGTGLGLAITRRIVEEHGGRIEAVNRPSGGLEVTITIPLS